MDKIYEQPINVVKLGKALAEADIDAVIYAVDGGVAVRFEAPATEADIDAAVARQSA